MIRPLTNSQCWGAEMSDSSSPFMSLGIVSSVAISLLFRSSLYCDLQCLKQWSFGVFQGFFCQNLPAFIMVDS